MKILTRNEIFENINTRDCFNKNADKGIGSVIECKIQGYTLVTFYSKKDAQKIVAEVQYKNY